jgi:putative DNA primase/helicase
MVMREPPWGRPSETYPRALTDADDAALLSWVQHQGIYLRGRPAIKTVMAEIISDNVFHPVRDYLDGLQWDGEPLASSVVVEIRR